MINAQLEIEREIEQAGQEYKYRLNPILTAHHASFHLDNGIDHIQPPS